MTDHDTRDLFASALPLCGECGEPVQRVEIPWRLDENGAWVVGDAAMVCPAGHRAIVEPV